METLPCAVVYNILSEYCIVGLPINVELVVAYVWDAWSVQWPSVLTSFLFDTGWFPASSYMDFFLQASCYFSP